MREIQKYLFPLYSQRELELALSCVKIAKDLDCVAKEVSEMLHMFLASYPQIRNEDRCVKFGLLMLHLNAFRYNSLSLQQALLSHQLVHYRENQLYF